MPNVTELIWQNRDSSDHASFFCTSRGAMCAGSAQVTLIELRKSCYTGCIPTLIGPCKGETNLRKSETKGFFLHKSRGYVCRFCTSHLDRVKKELLYRLHSNRGTKPQKPHTTMNELRKKVSVRTSQGSKFREAGMRSVARLCVAFVGPAACERCKRLQVAFFWRRNGRYVCREAQVTLNEFEKKAEKIRARKRTEHSNQTTQNPQHERLAHISSGQ